MNRRRDLPRKAKPVWTGWVAVNGVGRAYAIDGSLVTRASRPNVLDRAQQLVPGERFVRCAIFPVGESLWHPDTQRQRAKLFRRHRRKP